MGKDKQLELELILNPLCELEIEFVPEDDEDYEDDDIEIDKWSDDGGSNGSCKEGET